ncbi:putative hydrolases of HD superfamily [Colwellia chukchiensis]|uniref:Putative hydrolases of HD superfamily n=1 Tax=Colwellia chukchiensis TaxID=641665 RepID=A0A1H7LXM6_9GAMM|nr:HD domain-containing protein [Colwellia chukchiensis]SEL03740.1 putative hydrolases of HD superfamily [Colwellia chukchiensis]
MTALEQQLNFIIELDKLKSIYRQALIKSDHNRFENSAEHSWHAAMLAPILQQYAIAEINISRVMTMLLIHDIVEIDAGDMFAFADNNALLVQTEKEMAAAKRIFGLLPESQASSFMQLWSEFELAQTLDAKFANAMDCLLPLLQNMNNSGGSWARHTVTKSQVLKRNQHLEHLAPKLWQYVNTQVTVALQKGWLIDD